MIVCVVLSPCSYHSGLDQNVLFIGSDFCLTEYSHSISNFTFSFRLNSFHGKVLGMFTRFYRFIVLLFLYASSSSQSLYCHIFVTSSQLLQLFGHIHHHRLYFILHIWGRTSPSSDVRHYFFSELVH